AGEQDAETACAAPGVSQLARLGVLAGGEELALDAREAPLIAGQLSCGREPRPAIEVAVVTSGLVPGSRCRRQLSEGDELLPTFPQPPAQARPLADECLVGDLGGVVADDQEPGAREALDHRLRRLARRTLRDQLCERHSPAGVLRSVAQLGESDEYAAHQGLLVLAAVEEDLLGRVSDCPPHTAGRRVAHPGEDTAVSPRPRLVERMREQRQRSRLPFD